MKKNERKKVFDIIETLKSQSAESRYNTEAQCIVMGYGF